MDPVVAFVDDLMFLSRIREAAKAGGREVRTARTVASLLEACRDTRALVLFDLDSPRLPVTEGLQALRKDAGLTGVRSLGFFSHVHAERAQAATEAGCSQVLARGAFIRELPRLLA
jgi:DNA-binding NarL/FixJ family response regulator